MSGSLRYHIVSGALPWAMPQPGDEQIFENMNDEINVVEAVRTRMYKHIKENLAAYCRGEAMPDIGWPIPSMESMGEGIDEYGDVSALEQIVQSRLYAIVNQHIEDNREQIVQEHRESIVEQQKEIDEVSTYEVLAPDIVQRVQQSLNVTKKHRPPRTVSA